MLTTIAAVEIAAVIISIVAVLLSGGSLWYTHRADLRADRAERRAEEQIADAKRANLTAEYQSVIGNDRRREYRIRVRNLGPAPAHRVATWLEADDGSLLGADSGRRSLMQGDSEEFRPVVPPLKDYAGRLALFVRWNDDEGWHSFRSLEDVPPN